VKGGEEDKKAANDMAKQLAYEVRVSSRRPYLIFYPANFDKQWRFRKLSMRSIYAAMSHPDCYHTDHLPLRTLIYHTATLSYND
jgi:hypothetical protein